MALAHTVTEIGVADGNIGLEWGAVGGRKGWEGRVQQRLGGEFAEAVHAREVVWPWNAVAFRVEMKAW